MAYVPASVMLAFSRIVSRHRELAADRVASMLTGSPSSVSAALVDIDRAMRRVRQEDLRAATPRDCFHFVPARRNKPLLRFWATHPTITRRLDRLAGYEAAMQRPPA
jgi:Zn-dependent protease with chaperone function